MRFIPPSSFLRKNPFLYAVPLPAAFYFATMSTSSSAHPGSNTAASTSSSAPFPSRPYTSRHKVFPYTPADFTRADESEDESFYASPRFVTHIDDHAIGVLKQYYAAELPQKGRILDLCSSWISHFPKELAEKARGKEDGEKLEVIGLGMNKKELNANPILSQRPLQNLNVKPSIPADLAPLDATTCVVSIDYLTFPSRSSHLHPQGHASRRTGSSCHLEPLLPY